MQLECSVEGCEKPVIAKRLCWKHYGRLRRTGSLEITIREKGTGSIREGYLVKNFASGVVREHVAIAEAAIGKKLPSVAIVHHVDGDGLNNKGSNLVVCPNQAYHVLLHRRQRALDACGHADWRKCWICGEYGPDGIVRERAHAQCQRSYLRKWREHHAGY